MKKQLYIFSFLLLFLLPKAHFAQCDTSAIYANTTSNAVCFDTTFSKVLNCYSNDYPDHDDSYNSPFTVEASDQAYSMCLYPDTASSFTPLYEETETAAGCNYTYQFGVSINGIGYTPNSNEYFDIIDEDTGDETGEVNIEWHKEARYMFNANFGNNGGHINAFGSYHYHDIPVDYFTDSLGITIAAHSSIVGYAADGFPIYYKFVYSDPENMSSAIIALTSGYSLIAGTRPGDGYAAPDGAYTGLYYEDYEYTTTTLDSCNGRWGKTPDYPDGTYYYVLTDNYPYIPRCFKGTVLDNTFRSLANCPESTASTDCSDAPIEGCTDPFSCNYNSLAEIDDGSCDYNYGYDSLTITSSGTYTSPSGTLYNDDGIYSDTVIVSGTCDSVYTIDLTVEGAVSTRMITNPSSSGASDGEILFGPPTGMPAFEFSIDSGVTYSSPLPPGFGGLSVGTYWTVIKDGNGNEIFEEVELSATLPAELLSFEVSQKQDKVLLKWSTASEENTSHFEIERSTNGVHFQSLGNVDAHHYSQEIQSYNAYDQGQFNKVNYYRLKIVDYDGSFEYSETRAIELNDLIEKTPIVLFPNPASKNLSIQNGKGNAVFYNHLGKVIMEIKIPTTSFQTDISDWPAGIYFIQFYDDQGFGQSESFLKTKL